MFCGIAGVYSGIFCQWPSGGLCKTFSAVPELWELQGESQQGAAACPNLWVLCTRQAHGAAHCHGIHAGMWHGLLLHGYCHTFECCLQGVQGVADGHPQTLALWQVKLLWQVAPLLAAHSSTFLPLVSGEMATAMYANTRSALDQQEKGRRQQCWSLCNIDWCAVLSELSTLLLQYCAGQPVSSDSDVLSTLLSAYLTFYDVPPPQVLQGENSKQLQSCHFCINIKSAVGESRTFVML